MVCETSPAQRDYWIATGLVMAADLHRDAAARYLSIGCKHEAKEHAAWAHNIIHLQPSCVAAQRSKRLYVRAWRGFIKAVRRLQASVLR